MSQINDQRVELCGIPVSRVSFEDVLSEMDECIRNRSKRQYISFTNTESMYHALKIQEHRDFIHNATFSLCDGIGIVIAGRFWGYKIPRLNGPVLFLKCCEYGLSRGWSHFFYGAKEGIAALTAEKLKEKFPGLIVAGTCSHPQRPLTEEEDKEVVDLINKSRPDVLWVGLGLLRQERWIAEHIDKISVPWLAGVGGTFDCFSGIIMWAPKWIQRIGMEWLWRLCLQPRIRFKRIIVRSSIFMFRAIWKGLVQKF
jgi:N-acetylglucosaminyldiphosphoundecaprenol N-acetyl-beta-D-mannosaminyltransferase